MWIEGGEDLYLRALRKYTGHKNTTVKEVHEIGLSEIERLKIEFFEVGKNVFQNVSTPEEVISKMQTDPSMRYESKEQMLQIAIDTIERAYKPLAEWFTVFPKSPCKVLPVPEASEQHAPPAYYYPPLRTDQETEHISLIHIKLSQKVYLKQNQSLFMKQFQAIILIEQLQLN